MATFSEALKELRTTIILDQTYEGASGTETLNSYPSFLGIHCPFLSDKHQETIIVGIPC